MLREYTSIKAQPLSGGCMTAVERSSVPFGGFSNMLNLRNQHPGLKQRGGQRKLNSTADSTNKVLSLYQFQKTLVDEEHFYAQMSDGDVLAATNDAVDPVTGVFGAEIFSGGANQIAASWGNINDMMIFSNGIDQHQIYGGTLSPVEKLYVHNSGAAIPNLPVEGWDYSDEATQNNADEAVFDAITAAATGGAVFIRTPVQAKSFTFTVDDANGNAATTAIKYRKSDGTWGTATLGADGTLDAATSTKTMAKTGTITFTAPTDMVPCYCFGSSGYWYRLEFSATLSATVRVNYVTFASDWTAITNVWNGVPDYAVEVQIEGTSTWETYAAGAVDIDTLASGKKIMIAATDRIEAIYIDPGATPNATGTEVTSLKYWDGDSLVTVGTDVDGTNGMSNAGWITFPRVASQPRQFGTSKYHAHWYELIWDAEISADTVIEILVMPYFDISEFGMSATNCIWKDRGCYSFDRWGSYIYVSGADTPMVLNGFDYGILKAGDGRANKIVSMKRFYNEMIVWQEEKGPEGGCVTIFEGYSPTTFGKLVLSSKIGSMNAKCQAVVDGVLTATATDETIKTLAFFLSRYGVCATDGRTISIISDDIRNYFDPSETECIRSGYESEMWLEHDPFENVLRIGLVSGSSATLPNVFPVFDLVTKTWGFDTPAQELSCMANVGNSSGNTPVAQVAGGIDDGFIYQLNYGTNDVSTAINSSITIELSDGGLFLNLDELLLICKAQAAGDMALALYENAIANGTTTLSMVANTSGELSRRHRITVDRTSDLISLIISNAVASQELYLLEAGFQMNLWEER